MSRFVKILAKTFSSDKVLFEYIAYEWTHRGAAEGLILQKLVPAKRGGVFLRSPKIAPPILEKYGIIMPRGGMIFPHQTVQEITQQWEIFQQQEKIRKETETKERVGQLSGGFGRLLDSENSIWPTFEFRGEVLNVKGITTSFTERSEIALVRELELAAQKANLSQEKIVEIIKCMVAAVKKSGYQIHHIACVKFSCEQEELPLQFFFGNEVLFVSEVVLGKPKDLLIKRFEFFLESARGKKINEKGDVWGHTAYGTTYGKTDYDIAGESIPAEVVAFLRASQV